MASTLLKLLGLTCLLAKSLRKTMKINIQVQQLKLFFFILQVVGLASTLLHWWD
jgi:hypothetical protein